MKPQDLDRIRFITRHFNELNKGLFITALGLNFLSSGLSRFMHIPSPHHRVASAVHAVQLSLFVVAVILILCYRWYYRRTFGEVEPVAGPSYRPPDELSIYRPAGAPPPVSVPIKGADLRCFPLLLLVGSLAIALYVALRMAGSSANVTFFDASGDRMDPLFVVGPQVMDLIVGSLFLSTWLWRGRRLSQSYYLAFGAVLLGVAWFGAALGLLVPRWGTELFRIAKPLLSAALDMYTGMLLLGICFVLAGLLDHWQLVRTLRPAEPHAV